MPKQKKNSQDNELYFDIISPSAFVESEEEVEDDSSTKKKVYQIPIKREKFSSYPKTKIKQEEVLKDDEEYEEVIEEVVVEEPEEKMIKSARNRPKKIRKPFLFFKKRERKNKPDKKEKPKLRVRGFNISGGFKKKIFITVGVAVLIFSITFVFLTYAANSVTININTQKGSIDYTGNILIDSNIAKADNAKNVLPGRLVKISQTVSETFDATGKVNGGAKAKGKITIYNAYNTSPQILVQNTRFESPDGLIFKLDSRITVPGATLKNGDIVPSSIIANITASETGKAYNISPVRFTIPGFKGTDRFNGFYAESKEKFSGGSEGESIVVSNIDLKNAEKSAGDVLFKKLETELKNQIQAHEKIFKDSIVTKVVKTDLNGTKIGDSKEKFTINITGEIKTIAFSKDDYLTLIKYNVEKSLEKDEELFGEFTENIISIKPDDKKNQLMVNTSIQYPTKKKVDGAQIMNIIKGKSVEETKKILSSNPAIEKANIKLYPIWTNVIPNVAKKIHLGID